MWTNARLRTIAWPLVVSPCAGCGGSQATAPAHGDERRAAESTTSTAHDADEARVEDARAHDALDPYEQIQLGRSHGYGPSFERGDPCELAQAGCAWSTSLQRCATFVRVPACPPTLADAQATALSCNHASPSLTCTYGETVCRCDAPAYCGGPAPPPWLAHPASTFVCIPPIDARGCPTSTIREGTPCGAEPDVVCSTCATAARCVNGRWQVTELPPRP